MAKGLPGSGVGQGSFFEVLADRVIPLRPAEMNGRFCVAESRPLPVYRRRQRRSPAAPERILSLR